MSQPIFYFLVLSSKTAMFKLDDLFPECRLYREKAPQAEPLICIRDDSCPVNHGCMASLVRRIKMLFEEIVPQAELIILYFRKRNVPGLGAGVFWKDFREPRVITVNQQAWERVKFRGTTFQFLPSESFFLSGRGPEPEALTSPDGLALPK